MADLAAKRKWAEDRGITGLSTVREEIDVSGYDMAQTMVKERRRQAEAASSKGLSELAAMLLPLSVALARLTARCDVAGAAQ